MSIIRGVVFGVGEQINNTKLHNIIDLASISVSHTELATSILASLPSTAGVLKIHSLIQSSLASGATIRYNGVGGFYGS